jgi:4-hydroxy-2-oxoheptanedioate aldolase
MSIDIDPPLLRNLAKERLVRGESVFSMTIRLVRTTDIASIAHVAGFESVYIDLEHSSFSLEAAGQVCMACSSLGVTPLVRTPGTDPFLIARILDAGAMGIVVPGVQSAAEAVAAVRAVKHAPLGDRSFAGSASQLHYRPLPTDRTIRELDSTSMVIAMIESRAGLDAMEEIAAVDGVDVLLLGASDLSSELGYPGQVDHPLVDEAFVNLIELCKQQGISAGIGGLGARPDLIRRYRQRGATFISTGNDISFLSAAAAQKRQQFD